MTPEVKFPPFVTSIDLSRRMAEIASAGLDGRLLLLLGAGFSKDARNYPTGSELASILIRKLATCSADEATAAAAKYQLAAIAQQYGEKATDKREQLISEIQRALSNGATGQSEAERNLASIASMCGLRRIFTTNFDPIIEEALGVRARVVKSSVSDIRKFEQEARAKEITGVFHLMGDLNDPKITESDLKTHRSVFFELLRQDMLTHVFVMIGYSFRDDAITHIYDELFDLMKSVKQDRHSYIVTPVENALDYHLAQRLWEERGGIVVIPLGAGDFLNLLLTHLEDARYEETVNGIATNLGKPATEINERLRPLKNQFAHLSVNEIAEAVEQFIELRKQ